MAVLDTGFAPRYGRGQMTPDDDLKDKLAAFDRDLKSQTDDSQTKPFIDGRNLDAKALRASRIGIELMVAILAGVALGYGIDKLAETSPLFILLGSLLGFAAGVMNAWRALNGKYGEVGFPDQKQD